jgi:hypothetical protein
VGAFLSILVDIELKAAIQPALGEACDFAMRLGARDARRCHRESSSSDYNGFMRKLEADVVDGRRAAWRGWSKTRPDVQCKASAASETQPARFHAWFVVDTHETELVIRFGN